MYQTDLEELIILPHSRHYKVIGDQLVAVENEVAFKEYGAFFHIDTNDGSVNIDFDSRNIRQHTLFRRDEQTDKVFFKTTDYKLYSVDLSDFSVSLLCSDFDYDDSDLHYRNGKLYLSELNGASLTAHQYDFENCQKGAKIADISQIGWSDDIIEIYTLQNGTTHAINTGADVFVFDGSLGMAKSVKVNTARLSGFHIMDDLFFTIGTTEDGLLNISVNDQKGDVVFTDQIPGEGFYSYTTTEGLITLFTNKKELYKIVLKNDFSYTIAKVGEAGLEQGPYEASDWKHRSGYFYSFIGNKFHYRNQSGWVQMIADVDWKGSPWIDATGKLIGISGDTTVNDLIMYDLEVENILEVHPLNIVDNYRSVIVIQGSYYAIGEDKIYSLDIENGGVTEILQADFIPYLTSDNRSIGRLYDSITEQFTFVSFDGAQFTELAPWSYSTLHLEPIDQIDGTYMIYGLPSLTFFNEKTDELKILPFEGYFYLINEVRYNAENCFIDINNEWVYYYSRDTIVNKPLLIEGEDQLVRGYLANNTIFTSSSPFDKLTGVPFAQTFDDEVIELEPILGKVSISDAIFIDGMYYLLSFDAIDIFLHSLSPQFDQAVELASFPRPTCHFHESFYFLGPDIEGDINFRISTVDRGTVYYQYEFSEQDVSLLFDPSDKIGKDIGDIKFYDDKGLYFTATERGNDFQMWTIQNDQNPSASKDIEIEVAQSLIYPNPFQDFISFKKPVTEISIYDVMGQRVYRSERAKKVDNLDGLEILRSGLYLIEYNSGTKKVVERVVKM